MEGQEYTVDGFFVIIGKLYWTQNELIKQFNVLAEENKKLKEGKNGNRTEVDKNNEP